MPNSFKNGRQVCTVSLTDLYECPETNTKGTVNSSIVLLLQASNVTNRADNITIVWTDASNGNAVTHICSQTPIPSQQAIGCITGKLILEPHDKIRAQCGTHQAIELSLSVLETT